MTDPDPLTPASRDELRQSLAFALQCDGRKPTHQGRELVATIAAERLVKHLERSGFVIMKKPPTRMMTTEGHLPRLPLTE